MKIGIVSRSYDPRHGGVTEHVHHTAIELRRRGLLVTIIRSHSHRGEMPSDPEVNGVVSPPGDGPARAGAIAARIEDPERRAALAQRGRVRGLEFAGPHLTDRLEAVYRDVLARRGAVQTAA